MADDRSREATNGARQRNRVGRRHSGRVTRADIEAQMQSARADLTAQVRATRATIDATNERINARTGRNLAFAVLIGLILGVTMIVSLVLVKELFLIVAGLLIAFTSLELATAMRAAGRDVPRIPTVAVAVAVVPITYVYGPQGQWFAILGAITVVTLWRLAELAWTRHRAAGASVAADLGAGAFIQVYVSLLGSFAVLLTQQENGQFWTMAFLLLVVVCDIGAYASGLSFGKHPMAPTISPKKTWEGFAGAVLAALVSGVLLAVLLLDQSWYFGLLFGAVIVVTATLGDLAESLLKRDLGIKDISSWLPGHGGLLDRLDSILPSAVAAYVLFLIFA